VPKINVYLPDELATAVKEAQIPVSTICQTALERAVRDVASARASADDDIDVGDLASGAGGGRFKRFTPRAKAAVVSAQRIAASRGDKYVGTEHVLLGVIEEGANLAVKTLVSLDVDPADVRAEVEGSMEPPTPPHKAGGHVKFGRSSKDALQVAMREALGLGHNYIGCEHLLLGMLAVEDGMASQVLRRMGVDLRTARRAVVTALAGFVHARENEAPAASPDALAEILRRLEAIEQKLAG
jgi:ATP-dependent Clp protease ATP-binding subunit ClpC